MSKYSNVRLLQLNNYVKPEIKEQHGEDWVLNGKHNSYFKYVIDRYNGSATNAAIINSFVERIYGKGLTALNASKKPEEYVKLLEMFPKKELKRVIADFKLQGNAAIEVIRGKTGNDVVKCYHIPVETLGADKVNKDGDIEGYWYCQDWKNTHQNKPVFIPAFGFGGNAKKEILYIRPYKAGQYYFSTPDYQAALQYAKLEEEISNFSINHIQNGLSLGQIVNFNNGEPPEEVKDDIERKVAASLTGSSGKRFIISFNENVETATTIENIDKADASAEWHFWVDEARQQIITGHRVVSPMLFGIKDATGLGNNANEMEVANSLMEQTVIRPYQETILDAIDEILQVNNIHLDLAFKPLEEMKEEIEEKVDDSKKKIGLAGFDPSQQRNKNGEWGGDVPTETSKKNIEDFEQEIRNQSYESAGIYDENGELIFKKDGGVESVQFHWSETDKMKGNLLTHNHPLDYSFSQGDIAFAFTHQLKEIRAVTKNRTFIMELDGAKLLPYQIGEIKQMYTRVGKQVQVELTEKYISGKITKDQYDTSYHHRIVELLELTWVGDHFKYTAK